MGWFGVVALRALVIDVIYRHAGRDFDVGCAPKLCSCAVTLEIRTIKRRRMRHAEAASRVQGRPGLE